MALNSRFMETDEIVQEDPNEVAKIMELSRMNGLYEYLSRSIGISFSYI